MKGIYVGIDIGSSSSKAAIINENVELLAMKIINRGTGTDGPEKVLREALEGAGASVEEIRYMVATGYGRITYTAADKQITEISCHARGVHYLMAEAQTIIDIGGQDAKVIRLSADGQVENFVMNEKCAAGTGRFLEVMARVLGCGLGELSGLAEHSQKEVPISSVCTVFAESEVISRLAAGEKTEDVAKGAHRAIAKRVAGMCGRVGANGLVAMTGGVALNRNMVETMGTELGLPVVSVPHAQGAGAIGAAILALENAKKQERILK